MISIEVLEKIRQIYFHDKLAASDGQEYRAVGKHHPKKSDSALSYSTSVPTVRNIQFTPLQDALEGVLDRFNLAKA